MPEQNVESVVLIIVAKSGPELNNCRSATINGHFTHRWALDPHHDVNDPLRANKYDTRLGVDVHGADAALQQLTLNVFGDMGVTPDASALAAAHPLLVVPTASTDAAPPLACVEAASATIARPFTRCINGRTLTDNHGVFREF